MGQAAAASSGQMAARRAELPLALWPAKPRIDALQPYGPALGPEPDPLFRLLSSGGFSGEHGHAPSPIRGRGPACPCRARALAAPSEARQGTPWHLFDLGYGVAGFSGPWPLCAAYVCLPTRLAACRAHGQRTVRTPAGRAHRYFAGD